MQKAIEIDTIHDHITRTLNGVVPKSTWGETAYFYNPGHILKHGTYFATIKQKNGENDKASQLDREGIWRLNIGVEAKTFEALFGTRPKRPAKGQIIEGPWDFSQIDTLTPHPVYGWMGWLAVVNPSLDCWEVYKPLLQSAHARAERTFNKRVAK